jgi:hypothetical protein
LVGVGGGAGALSGVMWCASLSWCMLACWRGLGVSFLRCGAVLSRRCEVGAARALRVVVV